MKNVHIFFVFIIFIIYYFSSFHNLKYDHCLGKGKKLYETNYEIRQNLLEIFNYNYEKIYNFIYKQFNEFRKHSDKNSIEELNAQQKIIIDYIKCNALIVHLTDKQIKDHNEYKKELDSYKKKYILQYYSQEAFYYHHGLRFSNKRIKKYIYDKDIIDVGAGIGDSLMILQNYTRKTVHLYEISGKNIINLKKNIEINGIKDNIYKIHEKGLSNYSGRSKKLKK